MKERHDTKHNAEREENEAERIRKRDAAIQ